MLSDKRNLIATKAMDLIFALFDIASSRDVPFHQVQQLQHSHHGSTKAQICYPMYSIPYVSQKVQLEAKSSVVVHHVKATHPLLYQ